MKSVTTARRRNWPPGSEGAWDERKAARDTLARLRAESRRLDLELRLVGVFGLTPPRPTRRGENGGVSKRWTGVARPSVGCAGSYP